jgi:hypothetical protein
MLILVPRLFWLDYPPMDDLVDKGKAVTILVGTTITEKLPDEVLERFIVTFSHYSECYPKICAILRQWKFLSYLFNWKLCLQMQ